MKYITQFEVNPEEMRNYRMDEAELLKVQKDKAVVSLARLVAKDCEFQQETIHDKERHTLELQIFKYEDWVKFNKQLKEYIEATQGSLSTFNLIMVGKMLKQLESKVDNETIEPCA